MAGDSVYITDIGLVESLATQGGDAVYPVWASGNCKTNIKDKQL